MDRLISVGELVKAPKGTYSNRGRTSIRGSTLWPAPKRQGSI